MPAGTFKINKHTIYQRTRDKPFLDVLLTVHLSIILAIDQLNAQILVF